MASYQTALITGGASGMGLAVAKALAERGGWKLHLLDLNAEAGESAVASLKDAQFYQVNVLDYDSLANVFQRVFETDNRLDFVYANAGIVEKYSFYQPHDTGSKPPPPPDLTVVDLNLKSVINTTWLAQHYLRQSKESTNKNIVMTASCGGFYRCQASPSYAAAKHGVVGFMRSIAEYSYRADGIRVNAICPASVRTNLLPKDMWDMFNQSSLVPIENIAKVVTMLIDGYDVDGTGLDGQPLNKTANGTNGTSANGATHEDKLWGKAVEMSATKHYYRDQPAYCDDNMKTCMKATEIEGFVR